MILLEEHANRTEEIEPFRAYLYRQAALVAGVSVATITRAVESGYLNAHRSHRNGPRTVILGSSLAKWIAKGKQTGRTSADLKAEIEANDAA